MSEESSTNGSQQFRRLMDDFLSTAAPALEEVVNTKAFGEMLGEAAGNLVALNRIGNGVMDLAVRNARSATRGSRAGRTWSPCTASWPATRTSWKPSWRRSNAWRRSWPRSADATVAPPRTRGTDPCGRR